MKHPGGGPGAASAVSESGYLEHIYMGDQSEPIHIRFTEARDEFRVICQAVRDPMGRLRFVVTEAHGVDQDCLRRIRMPKSWRKHVRRQKAGR